MKPKRWVWLALILITWIGAGLRLYRLDEKSLWSDEIATIATSMGNSIDPTAFALRHAAFDPPQPIPAGEYLKKATQSQGQGAFAPVAQVLKANVHPPLFFWLMRGWIHAFGDQAGLLRLPSALFGTLCIPMIFWLALELTAWDPERRFSDSARTAFALLSATLMAISAYQIDHAQDARQYTLLLLLALLAMGLTIRIARQRIAPLWHWLALALTLLAGLYTQYFFFNMVVLSLGCLAWCGRHDRRFLARVLGLAVVVGIGLLPWWPVFQVQLGFLKMAGHYTAGLWKPLQLPEKLWRITCEFLMPDNPLGKVLPLIILVLALASARIQRLQRRKTSPAQPAFPIALGILLAWIGVIIGGQIAIDLIKHSHTATIRRYLLLASPACYLLTAYGLVIIGQRLKDRRGLWIAGTLSILLCGLMLADTTHQLGQAHTSSDEFKQAALWINHAAQSNDVVLVGKSGAMAVGMAYYLRPDIALRGIDVPHYAALQDGTPLMRQLQTIIHRKPAPRIWLVFSHEAPSTRQRLGEWLNQQGYRSCASQTVPGVATRLWEPSRSLQ
jgi:uncharacterized membrane protein